MNLLLEKMKTDIFDDIKDFEKYKNIVLLITTLTNIKKDKNITEIELYAKDIDKYYPEISFLKHDIAFLAKCLICDFTEEEICETMSNIYWQNKEKWSEDKKVSFYLLVRGFVYLVKNNNPKKIGLILSSLFLDTIKLEEVEKTLYNNIEEAYKLFTFKKEYGSDIDSISFIFTSSSKKYNFEKNETKKVEKIEKYLEKIPAKDLHKLLHNTNIKDIENVFFLLNLEAKRNIYNDRTDKFIENLKVIEKTKIFPEKNTVLESCENILLVLDNFDSL